MTTLFKLEERLLTTEEIQASLFLECNNEGWHHSSSGAATQLERLR
jgi:hypothetical protein